MNVLILSKDPTLFESGLEVFGDTRQRHQRYARQLRERFGTGSSIRIIGYTPDNPRYQVEHLADGLTLYPTRSIHRFTFLWGVFRQLSAVLRGWKPDLITVQTPWEEGMLGYLLSRLIGAKFFLQIHFDLFSESWREEHRLNKWRRLVAIRLLKRSDAIRVVAQALKRKIQDLGIPANQIFVVPVGINFKPIDSGAEKDTYKEKISPRLVGKPVVLFTGRFYPPKNLSLWVEIAEQITCVNPEVIYVMAGDGPLFQKTKQLVQEKQLSDKFYFLGKVGHERLPEIYAAADVFLLTSNYEGYGRVIVEANLSGLPVVSTRSTGPDDLIVHGKTGYLHDLDDKEGLVQSVLRFINDENLRKKMGDAGKTRVENEFSTASLVKKLVDVWETVCGELPEGQKRNAGIEGQS
ncbi:MAG: glycosyltransferase family 4 protein [Bacteroidetes bacterium]|nr:glycosyltransferase family 4 protein [Bacteroidota bacterium]